MAWFSKPRQPLAPHVNADTPQVIAPKLDPETQLATFLREYETHFFNAVKNAHNTEADAAIRVVAQARNFVSESRLGYALARPLLSHVRYWPSWSTRSDFSKYANGPFTYVDGENRNSKPPETIVVFKYKENIYTLNFIDEGLLPWASDDMNSYGKVSLLKDNSIVLGLDIAQDISKGDASFWRMIGVNSLRPGPWMKDLIEMAAYIDGTQARQIDEWRNNDAISRASQIELPDSSDF